MGCGIFTTNTDDPKGVDPDVRNHKRTTKLDCRKKSAKCLDTINENIIIKSTQLTEEDCSFVKARLKSHDLFCTLEEVEVQEMVLNMVKVTTPKNSYVYHEKDQGCCFFLIQSGEVQIQINNQVTRTLTSGSSFGELALLYRSERSASVKSRSSDLILFLLKSKDFKEILTKINEKKNQIANSILTKMQIFFSLSTKQKCSIVQNFQRKKFREREFLFQEGQSSDEFYIIEKGKVSLTFQDPSKRDIEIGELESFGESSLKQSQVRQGSALALTEVTCFYIDKDSLERCLGDNFNSILFQNVKKWALKNSPIFCDLSNRQIERLSSEFKIKHGKKNDIIMDEGKEVDAIVICLEGRINNKLPGYVFFDEFFLCDKLILERWLLVNECGAYAQLSFSRIKQILQGFSAKRQSTDQVQKQSVRRRSTLKENEHPFLNFQNFDYLTKLGEGQFGQVYLIKDRKLSTLYALKCIEKAGIVNEGMEESVISERKILSMINHPLIVGYYKAYQDSKHIYLLLEYISGIQMYYAIREIGILPKSTSRYYFGSILLAIEYLHSMNIIYRDAKPENCIVDHLGKVYLIDLGTSKVLSKEHGFRTETIIGTPHYLAPEVMQGKGYSFQVDYWSLGVLLFEFASGRLPFAENLDNPYEIYAEVMRNRLCFPHFMKDECEKAIIAGLLEKDPALRLERGNLEEIKKSRYFNGFLWRDLEEGKIDGPYIPRRFREKKSRYEDIKGFPLLDYLSANHQLGANSKVSAWEEDAVK